jgi:hypothetical protein
MQNDVSLQFLDTHFFNLFLLLKKISYNDLITILITSHYRFIIGL